MAPKLAPKQDVQSRPLAVELGDDNAQPSDAGCDMYASTYRQAITDDAKRFALPDNVVLLGLQNDVDSCSRVPSHLPGGRHALQGGGDHESFLFVFIGCAPVRMCPDKVDPVRAPILQTSSQQKLDVTTSRGTAALILSQSVIRVMLPVPQSAMALLTQ